MALYAPRNLNAPPRCRFSHLKKSSPPAFASAVREVITGVRCAMPSMRCAAASMSSKVTGDALTSDPLQRECDALAHADAHRAERPPATGALQLIHRSGGEARTAHAEGMAERDRAPLRIDVRSIVSDPKLAQDGKGLRRKCLIELHEIEVTDAQPQPIQQPPCGWNRSETHDPRRHTRYGCAEDACPRSESVSCNGRFARQQQRTGAVVDTGGISRRHCPATAKGCAELRQRLQAGRTGMLIAVDDRRVPFARGNGDRHDLLRQVTVGLGGRSTLLTAQRKRVLICATDPTLLGDILRRLGHRVDAVLL